MLTLMMPSNDAYKTVPWGGSPANAIIGDSTVGYYDDGLWLIIRTRCLASVVISDPAWEYNTSWDDKHLFLNGNRSSGNYTLIVNATQIDYYEWCLPQQTKTITFDIEVDCLNITSWHTSVSNSEVPSRNNQYDGIQDIVMHEGSHFATAFELSFNKYISIRTVNVPNGVNLPVAFSERYGISNIVAPGLGVGTHHVLFYLDYGLTSPVVLHGQTIRVEFNITVIPSPVITSYPITDYLVGDYFYYAPEADEITCHIEWNPWAATLPSELTIQRTFTEAGYIRETITGTITESFTLSIRANTNYRLEYQNVNITVHPRLTQNMIAESLVGEGEWSALIQTTCPATLAFEGLPHSISVTRIHNQEYALAGHLTAGIYSFTARATSNVLSQYSNQTYSIRVLPDLHFMTSPSINCTVNDQWDYAPWLNGQSVAITILNAPSWVSFEDGILAGIPTEPGAYEFEINGCRELPYSSINQSFVLIVHPQSVDQDLLKPVAAFTVSKYHLSVDFIDRSWSATSWAWNFGDGTNSTDQDVHHVYEANGTYAVTLTAFNAHGSDIFSKTIMVSVGNASGDNVEDSDDDEANDGTVTVIVEEENNWARLLSWISASPLITGLGAGFNWTLLLIIPIILCVVGYHRTRHRILLMIALILTIILLASILL